MPRISENCRVMILSKFAEHHMRTGSVNVAEVHTWAAGLFPVQAKHYSTVWRMYEKWNKLKDEKKLSEIALDQPRSQV